MAPRPPIVSERVAASRRTASLSSPNRFLRDGFFVSLTRDELALYLFLVLAGDRNGVSFYNYDRICSVLERPLEEYLTARNSLIEKDLIAFDGTRFQVLSLPARPVPPPPALRSARGLSEHDPATIRGAILAALDADPDRDDH